MGLHSPPLFTLLVENYILFEYLWTPKSNINTLYITGIVSNTPYVSEKTAAHMLSKI
jgi:hypothetical protein